MKAGNRVRRASLPEKHNLHLDDGAFILKINDSSLKEPDWIETVDIVANDWELVVD